MRSSTGEAEEILRRHSNPRQALEELRKEIPLANLLRESRSDPSRLQQLASESYRHDNGFIKIPLSASSASGLKMVLHVWQPDDDHTEDNIHDHRWDFASVVLCGELRFELYEQDSTGVPYRTLHYSSPGDDDAYQAERTEDIKAARRCAMVMAAGSTYQWNMTLLHRAWGTSGRLSATMIVQGPPQRERTTVLARSGLGSGSQPLTRLSPAEISRQFEAMEAADAARVWSIE